MIEEYGDKNTAAPIPMFEERKLSEGKLLLWEHDDSPSNIQANADNLVKKQTSSATCRTSIMSSCDFPEEEEVKESNGLDIVLVKSDDANNGLHTNNEKPDDDDDEEEEEDNNHTGDLVVDLLAETDEDTNGFHAEDQSRIRSGSPTEEESKHVEIHVGEELSIRSDIQAKQEQSAEVHVEAEQDTKLQSQEEKALKNTGYMASTKKDNNNDVLIEEANVETKCIDDDTHENRRSTKVSFSTIEIRENPMIIGVNPAVSCGVPLTIDWTHVDLYECSVEEYEQHKPSSRSLVELRMPMMMRDSVCRRLNFTWSIIRIRVPAY